jgi:outer membrane protein assembly factor BamE (lipoprotein component of BamABCDE complex)
MKLSIACVALAVALAGCAVDGSNLRPGVSTVDEALRGMGPPAMEFPNANGGRQLVYPRGPLGLQTFMVDVSPDGKVLAVRQVLSDEVFNRIRPGMTRDQVLRLIGPPGDHMEFPRTQRVSWEWRYQDSWRYIAIFSVDFDSNGIVVSKFSRRLESYDKGK